MLIQPNERGQSPNFSKRDRVFIRSLLTGTVSVVDMNLPAASRNEEQISFVFPRYMIQAD
jgi:hypothetical protein